MLEVIIARVRCGESLWTFEARHRRTAASLAEKGYVRLVHGITEDTIRVYPQGRIWEAGFMSEGYVPPRVRDLLDAASEVLKSQGWGRREAESLDRLQAVVDKEMMRRA